jgi:tRNA(Ile2) C34 agmatinyltransferase TiaS
MVPRCPRCDARVDPYGREGGNSLCRKCRAEEAEQMTHVRGDPFREARKDAA